MTDDDWKEIKRAWGNGFPVEHSSDGLNFEPWESDSAIDRENGFWRITNPVKKFRAYEICGPVHIMYWFDGMPEPTLSPGQRWLPGDWVDIKPKKKSIKFLDDEFGDTHER